MTNEYYEQIIEKADIPKQFRDKTFKNFELKPILEGNQYDLSRKVDHLKKFMNNELDNAYFAYLAGNVGNGKTHLAIATAKIEAYSRAKELNERLSNRPDIPKDKLYLCYVDWRSEIKKMRSSYGDSNYSAVEAINKMEKAEVLIIDDLFARSKPSSSDLDDAFDLLNHRYQRGKRTIITSNQSPDGFLMSLKPKDLKDYKYNPLKQKQLNLITERLASRILEACGGVILGFDIPNYRFKKVCI